MNYFENLRLQKLGLAPKTTGAKPKKPMKKISDKRAAELKEQKVSGKPASKLELDVWFNNIKVEHFLEGESRGCACWECGSYIHPDYARHATAHLLPKKIFKSVSTHHENFMIYGAGCGCHAKTDRVDKFITMKTWPEAARRIKILIPLLPIDELRQVSNQLLIALDNTP